MQVGALLIGYHAPDAPGLKFAGRVGTGFNRETHRFLVPLLEKYRQTGNPFTEKAGHRNVRFTVPKLVAEVAFRRWPEGGNVQQASFEGIRSDLSARDVTRARKGSSDESREENR